jgi:hypothetical protein
MHSPPTSVQSTENIQFPNISNVSLPKSPLSNGFNSTSPSIGHSACPPPVGSLLNPTLWNFSTPLVSNELRNARTSHPCERGAGFLKSKTNQEVGVANLSNQKFLVIGGVWCVQNQITSLSKIVIPYPYARASSTVTPSNSSALAAHVATPCCFPC